MKLAVRTARPGRGRRALLMATLGLVALLNACGSATPGAGGAGVSVDPNASEVNPAGDIPDNQAFVVWSPPTGGWSIRVPEGWARTDLPGGASFTDKLNSVTAVAAEAAAAPTVASVQDAEMADVAGNSAHFELVSVEQVTLASGFAILATYYADAPADPVTGKVVSDDVFRYSLFKDGTEVVLTLAGPRGADNVDPWKIVSDSFAWTT